VQTVTDVFHRRGGEETVPMYRVMLKEPTTLHAPFLIRAPLARVAQRTALCMFYASVPKAAQEAMRFCRKFYSGGREGAVAPVSGRD
jgi:hypothetical protein